MTTGPLVSEFSTGFSTLADSLVRGDVLAFYRALDGLYLAAWHSLWHLAGPFMLAACFFPFFALVFRGPVRLRLMGMGIFSSYGRQASRQRIFWRSVVAWSPMWVLTVYLIASPLGFRSPNTLEGALLAHPIAVLAAYGALIVWAVSAVANPDCSLPDRLAGTFLCPVTVVLPKILLTRRVARVEVLVWTRLARSSHLPAPVLRLLVAAHEWYWESVFDTVFDWAWNSGQTRDRMQTVFASLERDAYRVLRPVDRMLALTLAIMDELPPGGYRELGRQLGVTEQAAEREVQLAREQCWRDLENEDSFDPDADDEF